MDKTNLKRVKSLVEHFEGNIKRSWMQKDDLVYANIEKLVIIALSFVNFKI